MSGHSRLGELSQQKVIITFVLGIAIYIAYWSLMPQQSAKKIRIHGVEYQLLVADSQEERERGLMNVHSLPNADGMVFEFPSMSQQLFWNKNTYMDLDVYWMRDDIVVGKSFLPSISRSGGLTVLQSPKPVNRVVELLRK